MALSTFIKNFSHGSLTLSDGTGTPETLSVSYDNGDFSVTGLSPSLREVAAYESRGSLNSLAHTTRTYPSGSFTAQMAEFSEATTGTLADFILKGGSFSSNTSTVSGEIYTIDIQLTVEGTDFGDDADATITLSDCYCTIDFAEGDPNTFTVNFTVYGSVSGDLAAS